MSFVESALILTWLALAFLALSMYGLSRQVASFLTQGAGVSVLGRMRIRDLPDDLIPASGPPAVILFVDSQCSSCNSRLDELRTGSIDLAGLQLVLAVESGDHIDTSGLPPSRVVELHGGFTAMDIATTPYGAVVDTSGRVLSAGPVGSRRAFEELTSSVSSG
jgi:hypothetical protein